MELSQVLLALRNADQAGDVEAARRLAEIAKQLTVAQDVQPPAPPKMGGVTGALGKGAEEFGSSITTGIQSLMGSPEEAAAAAKRRQESIGTRYADEIGLDKIKEAYQKQGVLAAGKELASQVPKALAEQAPNIASSMAGAATGARLGALAGPYGALAGGALGAFAPSYLTQFGGNIERQAEEGKPIDVSRAAGYAAPQAALDVAGNFIPFGRQIAGKVFGPAVAKMLEKGATEGAEKLAQKGLARTLAEGTAIGATAEIPTEIAQQMLERAQAGLSLTSPDALDEYGRTAYQVGLLAPLGAVGRLSERGAARDAVAAKQREKQAQDIEAQQRAQQAEEQAQALARQKPEYLIDLQARYDKANAKYKELENATRIKAAKDDVAAIDAKKAAQQEFNDYRNSDEFKTIRAEYNRARPDFANLKQLQAQQAEAQRLNAIRQQPGFQAAIPGMEEFSAVQPPVQLSEEERNAQAASLAQQQAELQGLLEDHQAKEAEAAAKGDTELLKKLRGTREDLVAENKAVMDKLKELGNYVSPELKRLEAQQIETELFNAKQALQKMGDASYDPAKADKLVAKIDALQAKLAEYGGVQRPLALGKATQQQFAEPLNEFAARTPKDFLPAQQVAEQEQAALEESRAADEATAREAERQRKVVPEELALRRMAEPTLGERIQRATAQPEAAPEGSPVMGRTAQQLEKFAPAKAYFSDAALSEYRKEYERGNHKFATFEEFLADTPEGRKWSVENKWRLDEGLLHTAKEPKPLPESTARRVPGEGFRLYNERGEPQRPSDYKSLATRLASALANKDLTDDAYNFLRRAEEVLPQADYKAEELRRAEVKRGPGTLARVDTATDISQTEGFLTLLDQQLAKIERGEEGIGRYATTRTTDFRSFPTSATRAEVAKPTMAELADIKKYASADPRDLTKHQQDLAKAYDKFVREGKTPAQAAQYAYRSVVAQPEEADRTAVRQRGVERSKRAEDITAETIRGEKRAGELSVQAELEPLLRNLEKAQQDTAGIQSELFPEEGKKLGAIKPDAEAFQRFLRSPYVNKLRKEIRESKAIADRASDLNKLREEVDKMQREVDAMKDINLQYSQAASIVRHGRGVAKLGTELREANAALVDMELNRAQIVGRIEELERLRADFDKQAEANGFPQSEMSLRFEPMLSEYAAVNKELKSLEADLEAVTGAMKTLDDEIRVEKARSELARLNPLTTSKEKVAAAEAKLQEARNLLGVTQRKRSAAVQEGKAGAAAKRRADEAVASNKAVDAAAEKVKEEQKRLEAIFGKNVAGKQYDAITAAQRLARTPELSHLIKLSAEEQQLLDKNPMKVLGGFRSRQTDLESTIQKAQQSSREAAIRGLDKLKSKLDALRAAYSKAGADKRATMIDTLHNYERMYDQSVERINTKPVVWPGMKKQIDELARTIRTADMIEDGINSGRYVTPEERAPKAAKLRDNKTLAALRSQAEEKRKAKEAATRANAPTTSGAALTKSEVAKQTKPQKTLYSSKGVPPAQDLERKVAAMRAEQAKIEADEEHKAYAAKIEKKLKEGKPLNVFEESFVVQKAKAQAVKQIKGTEAVAETSAQQDALSDAAAEAVNDGRILDALDEVAKTSKLPFIRETAEQLKKLVSRTRVLVVDDVQLEDGTPVPAAYNSKENAILIRPTALTEANLIHEAVHAATMRALEGPESNLNADQLAAKRELTAMFNKLKKDGMLSGEYAAENVKEFASEVQSNANLRAKMAEQKWFGSNMLKRALNAFLHLIGVRKAVSTTEAAQQLIERLYMQSGKVNAQIAPAPQYKSALVGSEPTKLKQLEDNLFGLGFRQQFVDRLAATDAGLVRAQNAGALSSLEAENAQYFMRLADNTAQAAGQFITYGPMKVVSEETPNGREYRYEAQEGPTLLNMSEYMDAAAKAGNTSPEEIERLVTVRAAGLRAQAIPNGWERLNTSDPAAVKAEFDKDNAYLAANPQVKKLVDAALDEYKKYNDGLLDFAEQCDYLSKDEVKRLKATPYVPYYRVEEGQIKLFVDKELSMTIGSIADNPDLKQLLGDDTKIMPILTSAVQNTFMLSRAAMKNKATLETTDALFKAGISTKRGEGAGPANPSTLHYKFKGKPAFAVIDADTFGIPASMIVRGMEGIKTNIPMLVKLMGIPANLLRKFVTRNPLVYPVRQLIREPINAYLVSGVDGVPILNALKEMSHMRNGRSDAETELMRGLAISSNVFSGNEQDMQMFLRDVAAGKGKWDKLMGAADALALQADAATRAVIYNDALKKGLSKRQSQIRALEAQNFSRRGLSPSMQYLNTMIPFFNAQIQGLDAMYRSLRGQMPFSERLEIQRKFKARALLLATGAMAYAFMMQDDDDYRKAKPEERYGNFFVRLPGVEAPLKLPVPFEIGVVVMGTAQALVDAAMSDTKAGEAAAGIGKQLWQSTPSVLPAAARPILEAYYNRTAVGPIESTREQEHLQPGERYRPETTGVAKALGSAVGVSPVMLDHLARGYTSSLGMSVLHMFDPLFGEASNKVATPANKMPFAGGLFQTSDGRFFIDRAYDRMEEVNQAKGTYDDLMRKGERARAESFAQRYAGLLAQADTAGTFKQRMGQMFADERAIRGNVTMPADEKEALLKRIKEAENREAKAFYAATERTTPQ